MMRAKCLAGVRAWVLLLTMLLLTSSLRAQAPQGSLGSPRVRQPWTMLVYMAADNNLDDQAELGLTQMSQSIRHMDGEVIVLADRASSDEAGAWTEGRVVRVLPAREEGKPHVEVLKRCGEINMGDPAVLEWFVREGLLAFPARRTRLVLWNHGGSWPVMASDEDVPGKGKEGDHLTLPEMREALSAALAGAKLSKFDIIDFDMCIMGTLETVLACRGLTDYLLFSQAIVPGGGVPFDRIRAMKEHANPASAAAESLLCFRDYHRRRQSLTLSYDDVTMSLLDLRQLDGFMASLDALCGKLQARMEANWSAVSKGMFFAHNFCGRSDIKRKDKAISAIDLMDCLQRVRTNIPDFPQADFEAFQAAFKKLVIARMQGGAKSTVNGLSIYGPFRENLFRKDYPQALMGQNAAWLSLLQGLYRAQAGQAAPQITDLRLTDGQGRPVQTIVPLAGGLLQFTAEGRHILSTSVALCKQVEQGHMVFYDLALLDQAYDRRKRDAVADEADLVMPQYVDGANLLRKEVDGLMLTLNDGQRRALVTVEMKDPCAMEEFTVRATALHPDFNRQVVLEIEIDTAYWQVQGVKAIVAQGEQVLMRAVSMEEGQEIQPMARVIRPDGTNTWVPTGQGPLKWGKKGPSLQFEMCPAGAYAMIVEAETINGGTGRRAIQYQVQDNQAVQQALQAGKGDLAGLKGAWSLQQARGLDAKTNQPVFAALAKMEFTDLTEAKDKENAASLWPGQGVTRFAISGGAGTVTGLAVLDTRGLPYLSLYLPRKGKGAIDQVLRPYARDAMYLAFREEAGGQTAWTLKDMGSSTVLRLVRP